jgi:hypothetical protein
MTGFFGLRTTELQVTVGFPDDTWQISGNFFSVFLKFPKSANIGPFYIVPRKMVHYELPERFYPGDP